MTTADTGKPAVPNAHQPLTILLVEDDDGDAMAVERAFRRLKIANPIVRAIDGLDALELLRGVNGKVKPSSPLVMLVDINMPRLNGIEFVKALRDDQDLHSSIVFILTTSKHDEDIVASYEQNVAGYILKSKAGEDFLNLTQLLDSYWRIVEIP